MHEVTAAERSEWRWRLTRGDLLNATRREYCGGTSHALGSTAYKVAYWGRFGSGIKSEKKFGQDEGFIPGRKSWVL